VAGEGSEIIRKISRYGFIVIVLCFCCLINGCGEQTNPKLSDKKLRIGLMITPRGLNDQGFNDLAFSGIQSAERKYGIESVLIEPATMADPEASLRFFAAQKFDAIIAVGVAFLNDIRTIAKEHPDLNFFVIDASIDEGNIKGITFREDEGSFLCGYLGAKMSRTGKIGFVGGLKIEVIMRFLNGFKQGALFAASGSEVIEKFIADDFSGFNKPDLANTIATELYKDGCDVIYHAAGASGLGVIAAALKAKKFVIGVDMNQDSMAPGLVLTSMLKRVDFVVEDIVKTISENKNYQSVQRSYGISDGAINITDFQFTAQLIGDELIGKLNNLKKDIVSGKLHTSFPASSSSYPGN